MATTIQIDEETKELISTFGSKKDSYDDIVRRLYQMAVKEQLREFLLSSEQKILFLLKKQENVMLNDGKNRDCKKSL